jgi:hypothetical protein
MKHLIKEFLGINAIEEKIQTKDDNLWMMVNIQQEMLDNCFNTLIRIEEMLKPKTTPKKSPKKTFYKKNKPVAKKRA